MPNRRHKRNLRRVALRTATGIEARILQSDADLFASHYNVLEVVRPFFPGELPDEALKEYTDAQIQSLRWVHVIKLGEVPLEGQISKEMGGTLGIKIRRIPLTQEQFVKLVGPDKASQPPPTDTPQDHISFLVLKTTEEK